MWILEQNRFDPATAKAFEGLFTQGWSWVHVRGSYEQPVPGEVQDAAYQRRAANVTSEKFRERVSKWGCYVPGVFGPHPTLNAELVNLPWPLELRVAVDGVELERSASTAADGRHPRASVQPSPLGGESGSERSEQTDEEMIGPKAHSSHPAAAQPPSPAERRGLQGRLETGSAEDGRNGDEVRSDRRQLDLRTGVLTREVRWHVGGKTLQLVFERLVSCLREGLIAQRLSVRASEACEVELIAGIDGRVRTNGHDHFTSLQCGARGAWITCDVRTDGDDVVHAACALRHDGEGAQVELEERRGAWRAVIDAGPEEARAEKITFVRQGKETLPSLKELPEFDGLLREHAAQMQREWEACDVEIEGDDDSQLAMRAALYHLIRAHPRTSAVAIDAKGYAGEAYWGRFFWDTEAYLLPFYAHTRPQLARQLCAFRVHTLEGARANAKRYGYAGARYAWESDHRGIECCPNWQYADHEVHVTADVVHGFEHYARATGDAAFVSGEARETVLETARYWLERLSRRVGDERVHLLGVMGPDEYTPISSNNAYTNRMVQRALELAARLAEAADERERFASAARGMWQPRAGELVLQCEEWPLLAEPEFETTWVDRSRTYAAQVSQERLYRSKCLKQADVLMLMAMLPHEFSDAEVATAWREYVPYTTHDSSLSPGAHALVALRLGMLEEAWKFWQQGKGLDLDVSHGGAAEGIHIAACGAMWQMVVYGFAGVKSAMETEVLTIAPRVPEHWKALRFPLCWRGSRVRVEIGKPSVCVTHVDGPEIDVIVRGQRRHVEAGASAEWN
ncbi:MAG: glycoside hydrolase family 65 protein [Leptolyngbya sp. PLA3]|nr:MAG: glycoside hydrolase family 65 protein [Cyanobacteria bacterium CYA]MCE7969125.1 glycoside hydrolase family 65 protein [Leptolyngbya sp. PL-A3]